MANQSLFPNCPSEKFVVEYSTVNTIHYTFGTQVSKSSKPSLQLHASVQNAKPARPEKENGVGIVVEKNMRTERTDIASTLD